MVGNSASLSTSINEVYLTNTSPGFNIIGFGNNLEKVSITIKKSNLSNKRISEENKLRTFEHNIFPFLLQNKLNNS